MRVPFHLLSLYTDIDTLIEKYSLSDLAHEYSVHTAEIDGMESYVNNPGVVVGKILSSEKHPESSKLWICQVDLGAKGITQILTASPNGWELKYAPVATVGTQLAPDFMITDRKMAGMMSSGMMCGANEIGLMSEVAPYVMPLEQYWSLDILEAHLWKPFGGLMMTLPWANGAIKRSVAIRSHVFEIDNKFITNRPDLFSVRGNAREFATVFDLPLRDIEVRDFESSPQLTVAIQSEDVLSYQATKIDVISAPSSWELTYLMHQLDVASHYDLVDLTNIVMSEIGGPLHAFDAEKIVGNLCVRLARTGESMLALDGKTYTLTTEDLVIADDNGPVAIAGIIGGKDSSVSETTKSIILESAVFHGTRIRLTSQRLGVRTDASTRYEKSLDPTIVSLGSSRYLDWLEFFNKSPRLLGHFSYQKPQVIQTITITASLKFLQDKTGIHGLTEEQVKSILMRLGFTVSGTTEMLITVPSWRATKDVDICEDIAEEIARIYGYDRIEKLPLTGSFTPTNISETLRVKKLLQDAFITEGFYETLGYSFSNEATDRMLGYTSMESAVAVKNAISIDDTHMRRTLAGALLKSGVKNQKHIGKIAYFEIGKIHHNDTGNLSEKWSLSALTLGSPLEETRNRLDRIIDRLALAATLENKGQHLPPYFHPGKSWTYTVHGNVIATFWALHPSTQEAYDIDISAIMIDIDFDAVLTSLQNSKRRFQELPKFQSTTRELNFVMDETTATGHIADLVASQEHVSDVIVIDTFRDMVKIGNRKKSITFQFTLSHPEKSLSDEDMSSIQQDIIARIHASWKASLRAL